MKQILQQPKAKHAEKGFSVVELLVVLIIGSLIAAIAVPQVKQARRLTNFNNLSIEVLAQLRRTRQLSISERQDFTFRYKNSTKQIQIIDRGERDLATDVTDKVVATIELEQYGLSKDEITYGVAPDVGNSVTLDDGTSSTALPGGGNLDIVFRPDGSVTNATGSPLNKALFFYLEKQPTQAAFAVSVLGASGRARIWKYASGSNKWNEQ